MSRHAASALLLALAVGSGTAVAQERGTDDVQGGHRLATIICSNCHVAAPDQPFRPILDPPAPSFDSIAQRSNVDADFIAKFLTTTHRDISNPNGMPNPQLLDFQIRQITAYLLSLKKPGAASTTSCGREIEKYEQIMRQARADGRSSNPESTAARLHRQPTPGSVAQAEQTAREDIEAVLVSARKLDAAGKQDECNALVNKIALRLGR